MMKLMDKHKNIINLLGVCTQDGEGAVQAGFRQGMGMEQDREWGLLGLVANWEGTRQGRG